MNPQILADVAAEMRRADALHAADYPDGTSATLTPLAHNLKTLCDAKDGNGTVTWADVLAEATAEAISETDPDKLRAELVQVAAVALRWIRSLDARAGRGWSVKLRQLPIGQLRELFADCEHARMHKRGNEPFRQAVTREMDERKMPK